MPVVTTEKLIRNRAITVIESLVPSVLPNNRFVSFRNEGSGTFSDWAEANASSAFRRFQVRTTGDTLPPKISNPDLESVELNLVISIAYPQDHRAGIGGNTLARDDAMEADRVAIERAVGMFGRTNFSAPFPNACWLQSVPGTFSGTTCDFTVINQSMQFFRSTNP